MNTLYETATANPKAVAIYISRLAFWVRRLI